MPAGHRTVGTRDRGEQGRAALGGREDVRAQQVDLGFHHESPGMPGHRVLVADADRQDVPGQSLKHVVDGAVGVRGDEHPLAPCRTGRGDLADRPGLAGPRRPEDQQLVRHGQRPLEAVSCAGSSWCNGLA